MTEILRTEALSKFYGYRGQIKALDQVSLRVNQGEIYAFLGLNGAGKTTLIRILLGLVRPSQGQAYLCGQTISAGNYQLWQRVGCLVEIPYAYPELTVRENLMLVKRLRNISEKDAVERVIRRLHLEAYADRKAQQLSLGNAQRLGLAKALLHRPDILILDEPSNGLDPAGMVEIRELLLQLAHQEGVTIFLSSHLLGEVAKTAERFGFIHEGRLLQETRQQELHDLLQRSLLLRVNDPVAATACLAQAGIVFTQTEQGDLICTQPEVLDAPERVAELLVHAGHPPSHLQVQREDLESYFLKMIDRKSAAVTGGR